MGKRGNPNWVKGKTGNPNGRPKTGQAELEKLRVAADKVSKEKQKPLYDHFIERCYENDSVLIAFLKKMVPDLKYVEGDLKAGLAEDTMSFIAQLFSKHQAEKINAKRTK